uniref:Ss18, like 2 n=1 Tax=Scophthalmus maximus TaxID=52904 RepID=A0A8D3BJL3_SCOMX
MSIVFVPRKQRGKAKINQETIQRLLDENDQLVRCITEYMQKGRAVECISHRSKCILHRNIVYLATIADASPDTTPPSSEVTPSSPPSYLLSGQHVFVYFFYSIFFSNLL